MILVICFIIISNPPIHIYLCYLYFLNLFLPIRIFLDKINKYALYIISKATFIEKIDNDKDFKLISYNCIYKVNKFFARNNQTQKFSCNITRLSNW